MECETKCNCGCEPTGVGGCQGTDDRIAQGVTRMTLKQQVQAIENLDLTFVLAKLNKEKTLPFDLIDEAVREYRRFMILVAHGYNNMAMCSPDVDQVWHTHILFTKSYATFCQEVFGRFVHHQPWTDVTPPTNAEASVNTFHHAYTEVFGEVTRLWGAMADADCNHCEDGSVCSQAGCTAGNGY